MKRLTILLLSLFAFTAQADPAAFVGVSYTFGGGGVGIGVKVLSDDEEDRAVAAVGATYYPFAAKKFGLDVSGGYAFDDAAVLVGWDFLQQGVQISGGWADIESDRKRSPTPVAPPSGPTGPTLIQ